jgi:hypothetical protein
LRYKVRVLGSSSIEIVLVFLVEGERERELKDSSAVPSLGHLHGHLGLVPLHLPVLSGPQIKAIIRSS